MSEEQETTGGPQDQWVSDVTKNVRDSYPETVSNVFTVMEQLLQSKLSDRELTQANLKEVATTLIDRFVLSTTQPEENNED